MFTRPSNNNNHKQEMVKDAGQPKENTEKEATRNARMTGKAENFVKPFSHGIVGGGMLIRGAFVLFAHLYVCS